jgi:Ca-activated chloride channel family protein
MSFDAPQILWFLAGLLPLWILLMRRRSIRLALCKAMISPEGYQKLYGLSMKQALLFLFCFSSLIIGLAGPRWGERLVPEYYSGLDIVLAFDVSRSMDLTDGGEGLRRLDAARQAALSIVEARPDFRYAACLGKGKAVLAIPLTDDQEAVINLITALSSDMLSAAGTNLQDLLETAANAFPEESPGKRRIILLSDGEDTKGSLTGIERFLQAKGIGLITVGVGSLQGLPVPQADGKTVLRRADGSPVVSQLRETQLQQLAEITGGIYWNASRESSPEAVLAYLDARASNRASLEYRREVPSRQVWFILAALLFFAVARFLEEGLWKKR